MYVPIHWFVVSLLVIAFAFWRMYLWIEKRTCQFKARDEWIELGIEREWDPKAFCEKYSKELPGKYEYYYLHKYYKKNKDEDIVTDAGAGRQGNFPDFMFGDKDLYDVFILPLVRVIVLGVFLIILFPQIGLFTAIMTLVLTAVIYYQGKGDKVKE